jgi:ribosomal protein S18 acetylase RimI-like enzyme
MSSGPFHNLVWNALHTVHANFAVRNSAAARYPADVVPYAALSDPTHADLSSLAELLAPNDTVYLIGPRPPSTNSVLVGTPLDCFQMLFPAPPPEASAELTDPPILRMTPVDGPDMVALTDLAYPGFFRPRTHQMGAYYGIRINNQLVAMAGERLAIPGYTEISAVVTHPAHTGKRYATILMNCLLRDHASANVKSFLHVKQKNSRAIALYQRMGFVTVDSVSLWPISLAT